jgi:peptide-methionine (S)-S-oxide reductase
MSIIKSNKRTSLIIMMQLITIITFLVSASGEPINSKKQMENKEKLTAVESGSKQPAMASSTDTITLGGGCFWCVEAVYERLKGVKSVESGYSGGTVKNPSYREVSTGLTGHAEVVQIVFDTSKTSLEEILKVFFTVHDPTTLNRQGADVGPQYRSVIFYRNDDQRKIARRIIDDLDKAHAYSSPIVTQLVPFTAFYKAEDYHQEYYDKNKDAPYCRLVIQPKLEKFEKVFRKQLKK